MQILKYQLHGDVIHCNIQFIHLKHPIQWFLVHSQRCTTITTVNLKISLPPSNEAHPH